MFDNLSERLERSFKILKGEGKITEINVAETLKDVRKALPERCKLCSCVWWLPSAMDVLYSVVCCHCSTQCAAVSGSK